MRIAVLGPHFAPDTAPTGTVLTRLVEELVALGHTADVVTSLPWYRSHSIEPGWHGRLRRHEKTEWGSITRLHPFPTDKSRLWARAAAFGGFTALASVELLARIPRPDVVLAMSPPITLGVAGAMAARRWSVPLVFNIQDVFPDAAVAVGAIKSQRAIDGFERLERFCYQRAAAVSVLSEDLAQNVRGKLDAGKASKTRVVVIPNFVTADEISPEPHLGWYRSEHDLGDATIVMYAGNVGHSQPLDLLLGAAREFSDRSDVCFVINGDGVARDQYERDAADLTNVRFVDYQPADRLSATLAAADIHLILLGSGLGRASVPSKMYSILAAGRPVVAAVDPDTEVDRTLIEADAGIAVSPEDPSAFVAALRRLIDDPAQRTKMGEAGRRFVVSWPSPSEIGRRYEELFKSLG